MQRLPPSPPSRRWSGSKRLNEARPLCARGRARAPSDTRREGDTPSDLESLASSDSSPLALGWDYCRSTRPEPWRCHPGAADIKSQAYMITGAVKRPGSYPLNVQAVDRGTNLQTTVSAAIIQAGGFPDELALDAYKTDIKITRSNKAFHFFRRVCPRHGARGRRCIAGGPSLEVKGSEAPRDCAVRSRPGGRRSILDQPTEFLTNPPSS